LLPTLALAALAILLCAGDTPVIADTPQGGAAARAASGYGCVRTICLTASDRGPYFTLADLRTKKNPPKPRAWKIKPPIWDVYPAVLDSVPIAPRSYTTETVTYLAEHEVRYGDRAAPYVALTFDCELGTGSTQKILETLAQEDVRATFFVQGRYVYWYPEVIRAIAEGGHEFGNHSFFHPLFTDIDPITATLEIAYTEAAVDWAVGQHVPMRYFRFPYGRRNWATRRHAASLGYQSASWDIDPRGWDPTKDVADVVAHIAYLAHPGGIVIMHCGSWDDANALGDVIRVIHEAGLTPGTLSDVLTPADRDVPNYAPP
jgi:peptidoglycan/xylan/chitin deacetylase (PgdA/CDA1 family)